MQNPYEDYIKIIDTILRKIEADPQAKVYRMDTADLPRSQSIEHNRELINFLYKLAEKKAVAKIESNSMNLSTKPFGGVPVTLSYDVHEPNKKLLLKERERLTDFERMPTKETAGQPETITLFFNADGDLYREPKTKYCYSLNKEKMREKIIRFLNGKSYQSTEVIQVEVSSADAQSVRLAIGKINSNAKALLGLKGKFIEGRKGSGYRISPQYKIQNG